MKKIICHPIGKIRTRYKTFKGIPIQSRFHENESGRVVVLKKYRDGLKDLDGFSHVILLYHLNRARKEAVLVHPLLEKVVRGVFATRSPYRPNHIGMVVVRIKKLRSDGFDFWGVDMLNGTPLLDIKPYFAQWDSFPQAKKGWYQKHIKGKKGPHRTRLERKPLARG